MSDTRHSAHEVLRHIRKIVRRVSIHSQQLNHDVGLTVPQLLTLKAVGELRDEGETEITISRVSEIVQLSSATVSRVVDRLVKGGLVVRSRSEVDRRRLSLSLSERGREQFDNLPTPLQESFVLRWNVLSGDDQERVLDALELIVELMEADSIDAAPMLTPEDDVREAQRRRGSPDRTR